MNVTCEYRHGTSPEALADLANGCAAAIATDPPYGTGCYGNETEIVC